jgi:hypothetical protein
MFMDTLSVQVTRVMGDVRESWSIDEMFDVAKALRGQFKDEETAHKSDEGNFWQMIKLANRYKNERDASHDPAPRERLMSSLTASIRSISCRPISLSSLMPMRESSTSLVLKECPSSLTTSSRSLRLTRTKTSSSRFS